MNINTHVVCRGTSAPTRQTNIYISGFGMVQAGRLAWFYMTGGWPLLEVDHSDNDGWNQKWLNLRLATRSQNQANTRLYKSSTTGIKGVYRLGSKVRPWRSTIQKDGKRISLGNFKTIDEASAAYVAASKHFHGEFARLS